MRRHRAYAPMAFPCMRAEAVSMLLPIIRRASREVPQRPTASNPAPNGRQTRPLHWLLVAGCWLLENFGRRPSQSLHGRVRRKTSRRLHRTRAGSMPARSQKRRARPMNAPWTPPESPRCAPRPPGLGADHWLLAAETLPTHQKFVLHRVSGENEFLMRWP